MVFFDNEITFKDLYPIIILSSSILLNKYFASHLTSIKSINSKLFKFHILVPSSPEDIKIFFFSIIKNDLTQSKCDNIVIV